MGFLKKWLGLEKPPPPVALPPVPVVAEPEEELEEDEQDPPPDWGPRNAELEAAVRAAPNDAVPKLLYADWLQQQGSPRGEWIAVVHALSTETDPEKRRALEAKADELRRAHTRDIEGPIQMDRLQLKHGFVVQLSLSRTRDLEQQLAHPAYLLLTTIITEEDIGEALEAAGRTDIRVVDPNAYVPPVDPDATAKLKLRLVTRRGQRYAEVDTNETFGIHEGSHSFLLRVSTETARWSYGCDGSLCEDGIYDDPVRSEAYPIAATDRALTCELRFGISNDEDATYWFRGEAAIPANDGTSAFTVRACAPLTGVPFDASPVVERPGTPGPVLVAEATYDAGVVPGHGCISGLLDFTSLTGERRSLFDLSPRDSLHGRCAGGADGTLTVVSSPKYDPKTHETLKSWLSHVVLPDGPKVQKPWGDLVYGLHPLTNHRVLVLSTTGLHVVDARTGNEVWRRQLGEVDAGGFGESAYVEHDGRLYVWRGGRVDALSLADGTAEGPLELPTLIAAGKNYGVGVPAFHPALKRTAWMVCVSSSHCGQEPRTVIGWRDADGKGGEVAIAEQGWAREERESFGQLAILPDGRIVAAGESSVWLVEPPSLSVVRVGPVGRYRIGLQLTPHEGRWRLWSCVGPAFLEFA